MSVETPEETTQTPEESFAELRKQKEELESQVQELSAFKVNETVRSVNLDPNEGNGAALKELLGSDASEEKALELVAKFGWQADEQPSPKHEPTKEERVVQNGADRLSELNQVTQSDEPQDANQQAADLDAQLRAARAAGDWDAVKAIGNQLMQLNTQVLRESVATHV